jgi:hypothetical protein
MVGSAQEHIGLEMKTNSASSGNVSKDRIFMHALLGNRFNYCKQTAVGRAELSG